MDVIPLVDEFVHEGRVDRDEVLVAGVPVPKVVDEVWDKVVAVHPWLRCADNLKYGDLELDGEARKGVEDWSWRLDVVFFVETEVYSTEVVDEDLFDVRRC